MSDISMLYVTASSREEALSIGRQLVNEELVACVNVIDGMTSIYRWQGETHEDLEAVLIAKTRTELVETVADRVKQLHSYDCPCVVSWPLVVGNPDYGDWLLEMTAGTAQESSGDNRSEQAGQQTSTAKTEQA